MSRLTTIKMTKKEKKFFEELDRKSLELLLKDCDFPNSIREYAVKIKIKERVKGNAPRYDDEHIPDVRNMVEE